MVSEYAEWYGNNPFVAGTGSGSMAGSVGGRSAGSVVITGDVHAGTKWSILVSSAANVFLSITANWLKPSLFVSCPEFKRRYELYPLQGRFDPVVYGPLSFSASKHSVVGGENHDLPVLVDRDLRSTLITGGTVGELQYKFNGFDTTGAWVYVLSGQYVVFTGAKRDGKQYGWCVCIKQYTEHGLEMPWADQFDLEIQSVLPNAYCTALYMTFTNMHRAPGQSKAIRQQYCAVLEETIDPQTGQLALLGWRLITANDLPPNLCTKVSVTPVERRTSARLRRISTASSSASSSRIEPMSPPLSQKSPKSAVAVTSQMEGVAIRSPPPAGPRHHHRASASSSTDVVSDGDDDEVMMLPGPPAPKRNRRSTSPPPQSMVQSVSSPPRDDSEPEGPRVDSPVYPYSDELEATVPQYPVDEGPQFVPPPPPPPPATLQPQSPLRRATPPEWFDETDTTIGGTLPEIPIPPPLPQSPPRRLVPPVALPRANQSSAALAFRDSRRVEEHHVAALTDHSEQLPHISAMVHTLSAPGVRFYHTEREPNEADNAAEFVSHMQSSGNFAAELVSRSPLYNHMLGLSATAISKSGHTPVSKPNGQVDVWRTVVEQAVLPELLKQVAELAVANAALRTTVVQDKLRIDQLSKANAALTSESKITGGEQSPMIFPATTTTTTTTACLDSQPPPLEHMIDDASASASASGSGSAMRAARLAHFANLASRR